MPPMSGSRTCWSAPASPTSRNPSRSCSCRAPCGIFSTSRHRARFPLQLLYSQGDTMSRPLDPGTLRDPALRPVAEKVLGGRRLEAADARLLYATNDLVGLG